MLGKTVLYLPGFDHAGIATQSVVEKRLAKDKNLTRHDLGRSKFVETRLGMEGKVDSYLLTSLYV